MAEVLAWPLAVRGGRVATVAAGSDSDHAAQVAALLATRPGERPLVPGYGTPEPLFGQALTETALRAQMQLHGPDRELIGLRLSVEGSGVRIDVEVA